MNTIQINRGNVKMIAHRGLSGLEAENSHAAFVAAGNRSYYGIETDLHVTADGRFVTMHDDNTKRVSGVDKIVEQCTYDELKEICLYDRGTQQSRRDLVIPLLEEYIGICKRYGKAAVLELKNHIHAAQVSRILYEIERAGYLAHTVFISFDWENLVTVRSMQPRQAVQYLETECDARLIEKLHSNGFDLDLQFEAVTPELVEALHARNIKLNCWTCDDREAAARLVSYGVDYLTSNILE